MFDTLFDCYYIMNTENELDELCSLIKDIEIHNILNLDPLIKRQFCFMIFKKESSIYLNLYQKEYDPFLPKEQRWKNNGKYKISLILDDNYNLPELYDWMDIESECNLKEIIKLKIDNSVLPENNDILIDDKDCDNESEIELYNTTISSEETASNLYLTLPDIFEMNYNEYNEEIYMGDSEYINLQDTSSHTEILETVNGLKFNKGDIRWQIALRELITSLIGDVGKIIKYFHPDSFKKIDIKKSYYKNYIETSVYEKSLYLNTMIHCDICFINIDNEDNFYHNPECGDLCLKCFKKKKLFHDNKMKFYKKIILNEGCKIIFKRELLKTKEYLKRITVMELNIDKKYSLCKKVNNLLLDNFRIKYGKCSICLLGLDKDIYSGRCGHCFHKDCIESWHQLECPECREPTNFTKLYLSS